MPELLKESWLDAAKTQPFAYLELIHSLIPSLGLSASHRQSPPEVVHLSTGICPASSAVKTGTKLLLVYDTPRGYPSVSIHQFYSFFWGGGVSLNNLMFGEHLSAYKFMYALKSKGACNLQHPSSSMHPT